MILRKLTTAALAWPLVRHLFHFVRKYVAGQKCGSCPPFLLQTLNIKPRHTLLEPELYSWQQAISPAIKSLPHSGHAVEPIGTDTMQNQQIIVVALGSTLKGIVAVTRGPFCWKSRTCAWNVLVWHSFMAAVRRRHFWILLLWFVLVLQKQCAVFGMNLI